MSLTILYYYFLVLGFIHGLLKVFFLKNLKNHNFSKDGSSFVFRYKGADTYSIRTDLWA
jgi:hypothetical protein